MSSLAKCLKLAGKALNKEDVDFIKEARQQYLDDGVLGKDATNKALEDFIDLANRNVEEYENEITAKGGITGDEKFDLQSAIASAKGVPADAGPTESALDRLISKRGPKPTKPPVEISLKSQGYTPEEEAFVEKGGFGRKTTPQKFKERFNDMKTNAKTKLRQRVVDQFASIRETLDDPRSWMMANLTSSAPGAIEATIHAGRPYLHADGVIAIDTNKKSLDETLEPLGDELDRWSYWMAANRANNLLAQGKENLFNQDDIDVGMGMNRGNEALFDSVRKDFEELNNSINQIAVDTGLINAEEAQQWKDEGFYLPFYRVLEEGDARGPRTLGDSGLVRQQAFKSLKGGIQQLDDLMVNSMLNWNHLVSASLKNQAARAAIESAIEMGIAERVTKDAKSKNAIFVREDGKEVWYEVSDDLVLESLMALNWEGLNGRIMKVGRTFKRALTIGVTASPDFKIRNLIRDSVHAMAVTKVSPNIVKNLYHGWEATEKGSTLETAMLASGGSFGQSGYIHGSDPDAMKQIIQKRPAGTAKDIKGHILDTPAKFKKVWDQYQDFGARLENINRAADYAQAIARGDDRLTAAFSARDHLDFTRTGSMTAVRAVAQLVPFLNARLQGLDKLAREAPGTFKELMDPREKTQFKAVVGMYSAMSVAMYLAMKDDEEYKSLDEWEKRTYHHFKLPGIETMFKIPRPFEVGAIAFMAESVVQQMVDDEAHGILFAERLGHTLSDTLSFNPVPQILNPAFEVAVNKSFFTGRPIESPYAKISNLSPARRKQVWTSETAVAMAEGLDKLNWEKVKLSPVQIEHLVRGYLGWMGATGLAGVDMLVTRPLTDAPSRPATKFTEYPIIKSLVKTMPSRNTKYTTKFYEDLKEINRAYADIRDARKWKDYEEEERLIKKHGDKLAMRKFYAKQRKSLVKISQRMKVIQLSSMSPDDKRAELDRLIVFRNRITKMVSDAVSK